MRTPRFRRPSPALVIAVLALVVALGGTAYAVKQINGSTIKQRSIPGDRIRNNALTGTQINEARLGRVNEARNATNSKFALRSSAADSAANALNAGNASALGGNPASAFQGRIRWALVSGLGAVIDQSGGIAPFTTHNGGTGTYVVDFGASVGGKALIVTENGTTAPTTAPAAAPCGGAGAGATNCPAAVNDANHARVQLGSDGAFYVSVVG
jgi:hypothetical protein